MITPLYQADGPPAAWQGQQAEADRLQAGSPQLGTARDSQAVTRDSIDLCRA
jgi:hypothetical protein